MLYAPETRSIDAQTLHSELAMPYTLTPGRAAGVFLADMSLGAFANVLHAVGRVRQEQQVWVAAFVLETLLIVAFLQAGAGVLGLLAAFALRYLFSASANAVLACRALPPPGSHQPVMARWGRGCRAAGVAVDHRPRPQSRCGQNAAPA